MDNEELDYLIYLLTKLDDEHYDGHYTNCDSIIEWVKELRGGEE